MAKGQTQAGTSMADQNYKKVNAQGDETRNMLQGDLAGAKQQSQQTYGQASGAYNQFLGGVGGYDPEQYGAINDQIKKNISTGGYNDAEQLSGLKGDISNTVSKGGYTDPELARLSGMGGMDEGQAANIRSGYQNLINTGGISNDVADAMKRQAASGVQSVYSSVGAQMAHKGAAQGVNVGGESAQMARQLAQESAKSTTGVNAQVGQMRQQGTIAGLGGLSGFEQGAAAGVRDASGQVAAGRRAGVGMEQGLAQSQAQGTIASTEAQKELATGAAQQRIQSAGGLAQLYQSQPGYVTSLVNSIIANQNSTGTLSTEQAQIMTELSKTPGLFDNIMKSLKTVSGVAAGIGG